MPAETLQLRQQESQSPLLLFTFSLGEVAAFHILSWRSPYYCHQKPSHFAALTQGGKLPCQVPPSTLHLNSSLCHSGGLSYSPLRRLNFYQFPFTGECPPSLALSWFPFSLSWQMRVGHAHGFSWIHSPYQGLTCPRLDAKVGRNLLGVLVQCAEALLFGMGVQLLVNQRGGNRGIIHAITC